MFGTIQIRTSLILGYTAFSVLKICKRIFWREKKIRFSLNNSSYPLPNYLEFIHKVWDHKRLAKFHTLPHFSFWICQKKKKNPQKFSFICKSFEIHDSIYFSQYTEQFEFGFNNDSYGSSIIPLFFLSWKQGHPCPIVVFYLKKNRMAWRHAPFDKKKCGAMYCRCALFRFFKQSVRSLGRRATTLANYQILTPL